MKRLVISTTLCLISIVAKAEIKPYASILVGVESGKSFNQSTDLLTNGQLQSATRIEDFASYLGFRGQEVIGDQLQFEWQVEQYLSTDNSGAEDDKNTLANKNSYLGLRGNFGSIQLGRLNLLAKNELEHVDPWEYDGRSVNGLSEFTRLDNSLNNSIKYETPEFYGTKLAVFYSPDEKKSAEGKAKDILNAALWYQDGNYFAGYSYYKKNNTNNGSDGDTWHRAEVAYDQKTWNVAVGYQTFKGYSSDFAYNAIAYKAQTGVDLSASTNEIEGSEYSATFNYIYQEKLTYRLSYSAGGDLKINGIDAADSGYSHIIAGVTYNLNDKSKIFFNGGQTAWKGKYNGTENKISENSFALGMGLDI